MNIREYIPRGQDNAISRKNLCRRTGLCDRELRLHIEKANQETGEPILNLQDGRGYFIPLPSERNLVWQCIASETSRINKLSRKTRKWRKWLSGQGQYEMEF